MTVAAEDTSAWLTLAPSLITVVGVMLIGVVTLLMNRRFHLDRLAREESVTRREAFTRYLATMQEKPGVLLNFQIAKETYERVSDYHANKTFSPEDQIEAGRILREANDRLLRAATDRDKWSSKSLADQYAALVTITDESSPLLLTVKLSSAFEVGEDGYVEAMDLFIESMRIDAIMNSRTRVKREQDLKSLIIAKYPKEVLFGKPESISAS